MSTVAKSTVVSEVVSMSSGSHFYHLSGGPVMVTSVMEVRGLEGLVKPGAKGFISFQVSLGAMAFFMLLLSPVSELDCKSLGLGAEVSASSSSGNP